MQQGRRVLRKSKRINGDQAMFFGKLNYQPSVWAIFGRRRNEKPIRTVLNHCRNDVAKFCFPEGMI
jgi:hypothetical protein